MLAEDARAVAGLRIAAARAAVLEVLEHGMPFCTTSWDRSPRMFATKPTPHASCSKAGS